ncbi:hypothetical protein ACIBK8_22255 [Streptomyces sp. NPDC050161]|uniref:hypothetical protein n=1 Tax=Streptomyces sp. NPDC050161 TaxID=3365604 RepID=UPI0037A8F5CE
MKRPELIGYRAQATVRRPDGGEIGLGGWVSQAPGGVLAWAWTRAEQVAQQLGAPYDRAVRVWLESPAEQRWARQALAAGIPFAVRAVDGDGCTYTVLARPEAAGAVRTYRLRSRSTRKAAVAWSTG